MNELRRSREMFEFTSCLLFTVIVALWLLAGCGLVGGAAGTAERCQRAALPVNAAFAMEIVQRCGGYDPLEGCPVFEQINDKYQREYDKIEEKCQ